MSDYSLTLSSIMERSRIGSSNRKGWKLIHRAVSKNYFPHVKKLCQSLPEEIEAVTTLEGYTPLLVAAYTGAVESFIVLLQAGATDSVISHYNETAVQLAAAHGHSRLLIRMVDTPPFSPARVLQEVCAYLNDRLPLKSGKLVTMLIALAELFNYMQQLTYNSLTEDDYTSTIVVNTIETVLRRVIHEKNVSQATVVCKVIKAITPLLLDQLIDSKILPNILSMVALISNTGVSFHVLTVVSQVVHHAANINDVLMVIGGPLMLINVLKLHVTKETQLIVMECIAHTGRIKEIAESLAKPKILKIFVEMLSTVTDNEVIVSVTDALRALIDGNTTTRDILIRLGVVDEILKALQLHNKFTMEPLMKLLKSLNTGDGVIVKILQKHPEAIPMFMYFAEHSININLQKVSFEILWSIAADNETERRSLATALGPECIVSLLDTGNRDIECLAVQALLPLTKPFHCLQQTIIDVGGIVSLVNTIRINEDEDVRIFALRGLENLSYSLANRPNHIAQRILENIDGVNLLARIASKNYRCSVHAICTLSSFSIKSKTIRNTLLQCNPKLIQDYMLAHKQSDGIPSGTKSRTLCNLAYGCISTQSQMISYGGMLLKSFINQMSVNSHYQNVDSAFQILVLARVFTDSKQSETTLFALKFLIRILRISLADDNTELQIHTTARISSVLTMRAGLMNTLVSLNIVSYAIVMLLGKKQSPRRVAGATLCLLTSSPHAAREILKQCRVNLKLSSRIFMYSCGQKPSMIFIENWRLFCKANSLYNTRYAGRNNTSKWLVIIIVVIYCCC